MTNSTLCPKCDAEISNIHYQSHSPSLLSGYRGSQSFTAVAYPCGHAIGAVPVTWEMRLEELDRTSKELGAKIDSIAKEVSEISAAVKNLGPGRLK